MLKVNAERKVLKEAGRTGETPEPMARIQNCKTVKVVREPPLQLLSGDFPELALSAILRNLSRFKKLAIFRT